MNRKLESEVVTLKPVGRNKVIRMEGVKLSAPQPQHTPFPHQNPERLPLRTNATPGSPASPLAIFPAAHRLTARAREQRDPQAPGSALQACCAPGSAPEQSLLSPHPSTHPPGSIHDERRRLLEMHHAAVGLPAAVSESCPQFYRENHGTVVGSKLRTTWLELRTVTIMQTHGSPPPTIANSEPVFK
ncbi:hypothetical protein SKAU_G00372940 [Synaphobranchus kaupii]|uniref:Uncharacterized protein n=1 Tax=Synaphobranchus kaupii TaxID=118154 RepID=A0A9Q1EGE2_SYNKA|nr:hypothetical protein SKAU_G00372940 [Synaphobranchus kaupii]